MSLRLHKTKDNIDLTLYFAVMFSSLKLRTFCTCISCWCTILSFLLKISSVASRNTKIATQPVSQALNQPASQSVSQSVSQPASQPARQSASHSVSQSASRPASQSVIQSASQPVNQSRVSKSVFDMCENLCVLYK